MNNSNERFKSILLITLAVLILSAAVALCIGPVSIPLDSVLNTLLSRSYQHSHVETATIVYEIRLPRIILAAAVGCALALSGAGFQSLLRNDLADPYILGISSGASTVVAAATFLGVAVTSSIYILPAAGFLGAILVLLLVLGLSTRHGRIDSRSLLLNGVIVSAFLWAVEMTALRFAGYDFEQILNWLMGSLAVATWCECVLLAVVVIVGFIALMMISPSMNLYAIGEESARQLGLEAEQFKRILAVSSTVLAAVAVSIVGIIGFIGLISPHIARKLLRTPDNRQTLPIAAICGAILLIWSDTIARILLGGDILPVGIITAFLGAPFFCYQLRRS